MAEQNIVIIDYGMGNLGSIHNMLTHLGIESTISSSVDIIEKAHKLILCGVGSFDRGMSSIQKLGLQKPLESKVLGEKTPILGICLGMQLFTKISEEGVLPGLGWLDAETVKFKFNPNANLRIPHMGWNTVAPRHDKSLFCNLMVEPSFYFIHSYHVSCFDEQDVLATTTYGHTFTSSVQKGCIMGTQFHPEKSHKFGMQLLKNFCQISLK